MKNLNSVAFVAKIDSIAPIPGADNIEQALIGGWSCVIKKGSQSEGDLIICATTDATIPQDLSEAMGVTSYLRSGTRVRTVKLRGVYSECLLIPLKYAEVSTKKSLEEGDDVMEILGISKWEPAPKQLQLSSGKMVSYVPNPNFQVYHKFPNIKNVKNMFTEDALVQITRKLHGTNARYGIVKKSKLSLWDRVRKFFGNKYVGYEFIIGSHNTERGSDSRGFSDKSNVWLDIAKEYQIEERLWYYVKNTIPIEHLGSGVVIYGEIYGAGVQKNYDYGLVTTKFAGFDVTLNGRYLSTEDTIHTLTANLELPHVPVLYTGPWSKQTQDKFVINNFIEGTKIPHEGVVVKHVSGERHRVAKVINPDYLIHSEKHDVGDSH
jgi:RNA ligase (TIGR02306 family)